MGLTVLAGRHARDLFELAHEMQVTVIAAEACKAADAHTAVSQVVSGEL